MFINLQDVDESRGPIIYKIQRFIAFNNYLRRGNYKIKNEKELGVVKILGQRVIILCSTHNVSEHLLQR